MKVYTVYKNPTAASPEDSVALVPEDFSWWCFFFPFNIVWGLKHQCWLFTLLSTALFANYIFSYVHPTDFSPYINITKLPVQLFLGIFANDFLRLKLRHRGFHFADIITGKNEDEAMLAYLGKNSQHI